MEMVTSITRSGTLQPVEFDKENELHLRIVTLLADVKSDCFKISTKNFDKWRVQRIAGHSIPSIISSTAIAAALNCLNLYAIAARKCGATNTRLVNYMGSLSNFGFQRDFGLATEGEEVVEVIVPAGDITLKEIRKHITLSFSSWFTEEMRDFDMHKIKIQFLREHVECNLFNSSRDERTFSNSPLYGTWWDEMDGKEHLFLFHTESPPPPLLLAPSQDLPSRSEPISHTAMLENVETHPAIEAPPQIISHVLEEDTEVETEQDCKLVPNPAKLDALISLPRRALASCNLL